MTPPQTTKLNDLKADLVAGLESYLQEAGESAGYTLSDIDACKRLIDSYTDALARAADPETIMSEVQKTVVSLNELNEKCDGSLIETDQREVLCEIINTGAEYAGFEVDSDDLTAEWREW